MAVAGKRTCTVVIHAVSLAVLLLVSAKCDTGLEILDQLVDLERSLVSAEHDIGALSKAFVLGEIALLLLDGGSESEFAIGRSRGDDCER